MVDNRSKVKEGRRWNDDKKLERAALLILVILYIYAFAFDDVEDKKLHTLRVEFVEKLCIHDEFLEQAITLAPDYPNKQITLNRLQKDDCDQILRETKEATP